MLMIRVIRVIMSQSEAEKEIKATAWVVALISESFLKSHSWQLIQGVINDIVHKRFSSHKYLYYWIFIMSISFSNSLCKRSWLNRILHSFSIRRFVI